jgi:hypothetical protein
MSNRPQINVINWKLETVYLMMITVPAGGGSSGGPSL